MLCVKDGETTEALPLLKEFLKRHKTKPNYQEFGEEEMRRWWIEKDYSEVLNEQIITQENSFENIVIEIYPVPWERPGREKPIVFAG